MNKIVKVLFGLSVSALLASCGCAPNDLPSSSSQASSNTSTQPSSDSSQSSQSASQSDSKSDSKSDSQQTSGSDSSQSSQSSDSSQSSQQPPVTVEYEMTFVSNGGSTVRAIKAKEGEKFVQPGNPVYAGHNFVGWYADQALTQPYDWDAVATRDLTVYAKWQEVQKVYKAKVGDGAVVNMEANPNPVEGAQAEYMLLDVNAESGTVLEFYLNDNKLAAVPDRIVGDHPNNVEADASGVLKVITGGVVDIYFQIWAVETGIEYRVWVEGYEEPAVEYSYKLGNSEAVKLSEGQDPSGNVQWYATDVEIEAGTPLTFQKNGQAYAYTVEDSVEEGIIANDIIQSNGKYDIYLKPGAATLYIGKQVEPEPVHLYGAKIGISDILPMEVNQDAQLVDGKIAEYQILGQGVKSGDVLEFYLDGQKLNAIQDIYEIMDANNLYTVDGVLKVLADAANANIYLQIYSIEGLLQYRIWVTGYVMNVTATVDGQPATLTPVEGVITDRAVYTLEMQKGQVLAMKDGPADLHFYRLEEEIVDGGTSYTAPRDGEYTIYYDFEGRIWVREPEQPASEYFYKLDNGTAVKLTEGYDLSGNIQWYAEGVEIEEGQTLSFLKDEEAFAYSLEEGVAEGIFDADGKIAATGKYDIYLKPGTAKLWISKQHEPLPEHVYGVKIGIADIVPMEINEAAHLVDGKVAEYMILKQGVKADDVLEFYVDGQKLNAIPDIYEILEANNLYTDDGVLKVRNDAEADIYFQIFDVDGQLEYRIWVTGYVLSVTATLDDKTVALTPVEEVITDRAVYTLEMEEGQTLAMKDGSVVLHFYHYDEEAIDDGAAYVAPRDGEYTIYYDFEGRIWVREPEAPEIQITATVNGQAIELQDQKPEGSTDKAVYHLVLKENDKLAFAYGEAALHFYHTEGEGEDTQIIDDGAEYVAPREGGYIVYVNAENQLFVRAPEQPETEITATKNGQAIEIVDEKDAESTDRAKYIVTLEKGDYIEFADGETALHFYHNGEDETPQDDGPKYTAPRAGDYVFYVNSQNQIYVAAPSAVYGAKIGIGDILPMEVNEDAYIGDGKIAEYQVLDQDLVAGTALEFYIDGEKIAAIEDIYVIADPNNLYTDNGILKVRNDAEDADIYLQVFEVEGGLEYRIWVTGYEVSVTATVDGDEATLEEIEPTSSTDLAVFEIELEKDQVLAMKDGPIALHFYHFDEEDIDDGTQYIAPRDGLYTIYYDIEGKLWVVAPAIADSRTGAYLSGKVQGVENWYGNGQVEFDEEVNLKLTKIEDEQSQNYYELKGVELFVGDEIQVVVRANADDPWLWIGVGETGTASYKAEKHGIYSFYYSKDGRLYVSMDEEILSVYTATVNDFEVEDLEDVEGADLEQNIHVYALTLDKDDEVVFYEDGIEMTFASGGELYEAPRDGVYTFYLSKDGKIYIDVPKAVMSVEVNGIPVDIANVVPEGSEDKALYILELEETDEVSIYEDGEALVFEGDMPYEDYYVEADGTYAFRVDKDNIVHVSVVDTRIGAYLSGKIGGVEHWYGAPGVEFDESANLALEEATDDNHYVIKDVELKAGDAIQVIYRASYADDWTWFKSGQDDSFAIEEDGVYDIYVNADYQVWVNKSVANYAYYLVGTIDGVETSEQTRILLDGGWDEDNHAKSKNPIHLSVGDIVSAIGVPDKSGYDVVEYGNKDNENKPFEIEVEGNYDFYVSKDGHLYIHMEEAAAFNVKIGENNAAAMKENSTKPEGAEIEYVFIGDVVAGDALTFYFEDGTTEIPAIKDIIEGENKNNLTADLKIRQSVENASIYLQVWKVGADTEYRVWVTGYESVFTAEVDDEDFDLTQEGVIQPAGEDRAVYKIFLNEDSVIAFYDDGDALTIGETEETTFKADHDGYYVFYINQGYQVWVEALPTYSIKVTEGQTETVEYFELSTHDVPEGVTQYEVTLDIETLSTIELYLNGEKLDLQYIDPESAGLAALQVEQQSGVIISHQSNTFSFYVKVASDKSYSIYIYADPFAPYSADDFYVMYQHGQEEPVRLEFVEVEEDVPADVARRFAIELDSVEAGDYLVVWFAQMQAAMPAMINPDVYGNNIKAVEITTQQGETSVPAVRVSATDVRFFFDLMKDGQHSWMYLTGFSVPQDAQDVQKDYYLVSDSTDWFNHVTGNGFTLEEGEYQLKNIHLAKGEEFKVTNKEGTAWYPSGDAKNHVAPYDGDFNIYFRPEGKADWGEAGDNYIYIENADGTPIADPTYVYYLTGVIEGKENWYKEGADPTGMPQLVADGDDFVIASQHFKAGDEIKVVGVPDFGANYHWYGDTAGKNVKIDQSGTYSLRLAKKDNTYVLSATLTEADPVVTNYYLVGKVNDEWTRFSMVESPAGKPEGAKTQYYIGGSLDAEEEIFFVVNVDGTDMTWLHYSNIENKETGFFTEGKDGNLRAVNAGSFQFYLRVYENGYGLYITDVQKTLTIKVGDEAVALVDVKDPKSQDKAEYHIELAKGQVVTAFYDEKDAIPMHEVGTSGEGILSLTAPVAGTYKFYRNASDEIWFAIPDVQYHLTFDLDGGEIAPIGEKIVVTADFSLFNKEWKPAPSDFYLHLWREEGQSVVTSGTWQGDDEKFVQNQDESYSIEFSTTESFDFAIFYLRQGEEWKQTTNIAFNAASGKAYQLVIGELGWTDGKISSGVSFENGISPFAEQIARYNETFIQPSVDPVKTGYVFAGWYVGDTQFTAWDQNPVGDITLKAKWNAVEYDIEYHLDGGTNAQGNPAKYTIESGEFQLADPTKENFKFEGWYEESTFEHIFADGIIPAGRSGTLHVYAKFIEASKKVLEFHVNGGTSINSIDAAVGEKFAKPADPTKNGYVFGGWFTDEQCSEGKEFNWDYIVQENDGDFEVYAKWNLATYTITYHLGEGQTNPAGNPANYTIVTNDIILAKASQEGYIFEGWYLDSALETPIAVIQTGSYGNLDLYPQFLQLTNRYVRGTATSVGWGDVNDSVRLNNPPQNILAEKDNKMQIKNIELDKGIFRICTTDWNDNLNSDKLQGDAAGRFVAVGDNDKNIRCLQHGIYNIYVNNEWNLYFELVEELAETAPTFNMKHGTTGDWVSVLMPTTALSEAEAQTLKFKYVLDIALEAGEKFGFEAFRFDGEWYAYANLTEASKAYVTNDNGNIQANGAGTYHLVLTIAKENNVLSISVAPIQYSVTLKDAATGDPIGEPIVVSMGASIAEPNHEARVGYTFQGWFDKATEGTQITFPLIINGDVDIFAVYAADTYTVVFNKNDADVYGTAEGNMNDFVFSYDGKTHAITANAFTLVGYDFVGWNTAADGTGAAYTDEAVLTLVETGNKQLQLFAQWSAHTYTVALDKNDANATGEAPAPIAMTYGVEGTIPANPFLLEGKSFTSWNTKADGTGTIVEPGAAINLTSEKGVTVTLYAQWTDSKFATLDVDGVHTVIYADENDKFVRPAQNPTKEHYTFVDWYVGENVYDWNTAASSGITITARFVGKAYSINFINDTTHGSGEAMTAQAMVYGTAADLKAGTYTANPGYVFVGWSTTLGGAKVYDDKQNVINLTTGEEGYTEFNLYAKYDLVDYVITFHLNGGQVGEQTEYATQYTVETQQIELPAPTKSLFAFDGWYAEEGLINKVTSVSPSGATNVNLYAKWGYAIHHGSGENWTDSAALQPSEPSTIPDDSDAQYEISIDLNANEAFGIQVGEQWVSFDQIAVEAQGLFVRDQNRNNAIVQNTGTYRIYLKVLKNSGGYQLWISNTHQMTFNSQGGTAVEPIEATYGSAFVQPTPAPTKDGYLFSGWYLEPECQNRYVWNEVPTADVTVYAKWITVTGTLTSNETETPLTFFQNIYNRHANDEAEAWLTARVDVKTGDTISFLVNGQPITLYKDMEGYGNNCSVANNVATVINTCENVQIYFHTTKDDQYLVWVEGLEYKILGTLEGTDWDYGKSNLVMDINEGWHSLVVTPAEGQNKFKIVGRNMEDTNYDWFGAARSNHPEYSDGSSEDGNIVLPVSYPGIQYLIEFFTNDPTPIRISVVNPWKAFVRGTAVEEGWSDVDAGNAMVESEEEGIVAEIKGIRLEQGGAFKVATYDWTEINAGYADLENPESAASQFGASASFEYTPETPLAEDKALFVVGDFNNWTPSVAYRLVKDNQGKWSGTIELPAGPHAYKYVSANNNGEGDIVAWYPDGDNLQITANDIFVKQTGYYDIAYTSAGEIRITVSAQATATFHYENGDADTYYSVPITGSSNFAKPENDPTKTGYGFAGWYEKNGEEYLAQAYDFATIVTGNLDLYAKWDPNQYSISFNANGGEGTTAGMADLLYGESYNLSANGFTRTGYTFLGWNTDQNAVAALYVNGDQVSNLSPNNGATVYLYAIWSINTYTVTFNVSPEGYGSVDKASITVAHGTTFNASDNVIAFGNSQNATATPAEATNENTYSFVNWTSTSASPTAILADVTFTANFQAAPRQYTVTFDANGHGTAPAAINTTYNTAIDAPEEPSATGYTFDGWYKEAGCQNAWDFTNDKITAARTLYAKWTANLYDIVYKDEGGADFSGEHESGYPQKFAYETKTDLLGATKTGYAFGGWFENNECTGSAVTSLTLASTEPKILYAKWTPIQYTIAFNANGGAGSMESVANCTYDQNVQLPANGFTKTGYTFAGWALTSDGSVAYADQAQVHNLSSAQGATVTLFAKWTVNTYSVAFNANGGAGEMANQSFAYGEEKALTTNSFTKEGYTFAGWTTEEDGSGTNYADEAIATNLTAENNGTFNLYAKWTANQYDVTFNANGGTGGPEPVKATFDSAMPAISGAPTRGGYNFLGYFDQTSGGKEYYDANLASVTNFDKAADTTLYAQWTQNWILTFHLNGGEGTESVTAENGTPFVQPADPTKTGHTFGGWFTDDGTFQDAYDFSANATANLNVYAKWTPIPYSVTWKSEDGQTTLETDASVNYGTVPSYNGEAQTKAATAQYTYTFAGWSTEANGGGTKYATDSLPDVSGNTTYYAWFTSTVNTYTVTWKNADGTILETDADVPYGTDPSYNGAPPMKAADAQYTYTFAAWSPAIASVTGDAVYTAAYTPTVKQYTVTIVRSNDDYGTVSAGSVTVDYGTAISANGAVLTIGETNITATPTTDTAQYHYEFVNWTGTAATVTGAMTITANFSKTVNQYTVTFNANGHGTAPSSQTLDYGSKVTEPIAPSADGYTFGGWYTETGCTNEWVFANDTVSAATTLFAKWTLTSYSITYHLDGGTNFDNAPASYNILTDTIVLGTPTKENYTFGGWYDNDQFSGDAIIQIANGSHENVVLYAKWTANFVYALNLGGNQVVLTKNNGADTSDTLVEEYYSSTIDVTAEQTLAFYTPSGSITVVRDDVGYGNNIVKGGALQIANDAHGVKVYLQKHLIGDQPVYRAYVSGLAYQVVVWSDYDSQRLDETMNYNGDGTYSLTITTPDNGENMRFKVYSPVDGYFGNGEADISLERGVRFAITFNPNSTGSDPCIHCEWVNWTVKVNGVGNAPLAAVNRGGYSFQAEIICEVPENAVLTFYDGQTLIPLTATQYDGAATVDNDNHTATFDSSGYVIIYLKKVIDSSVYNIWAGRLDDKTGVYLSGKIGGADHYYGSADVDFDENANKAFVAAEPGDEVNDYVLTNVELKEGDQIRIVERSENTEIWTCHGGPSSEYVSIGKTGRYNIYLSKTGVTSVEAISYIYTINMPNWVADDEATVFAWSWGGSQGDKWTPVALGEPGTGGSNATELVGTVELPADRTGFKLVRFPKGTSEPNWDDKFNETGNLSVGSTSLTVEFN